jgi:hypothetical protein
MCTFFEYYRYTSVLPYIEILYYMAFTFHWSTFHFFFSNFSFHTEIKVFGCDIYNVNPMGEIVTDLISRSTWSMCRPIPWILGVYCDMNHLKGPWLVTYVIMPTGTAGSVDKPYHVICHFTDHFRIFSNWAWTNDHFI